MVPAATGSDTGGSLRIPATACGVSSIKPTFGLVSTHGVIPLAWSLDHAGPMARSAAGVAALLGYMAGPDPGDPASLAPPRPPATYPLRPRAGARPLAGTRVGVPDKAMNGVDAEVAALFTRFLGELRGLGAEVVEVPEPPAAATMILTAVVDAGVYHAQFTARTADYTTDVQALVAASRASAKGPAEAYLEAQRDRTRYTHAWNRLFAERGLAAVVKPGASRLNIRRDTPLGLTPEAAISGLGDYVWADYTGLPVVMSPAGRGAASGLPFGVQIGGPPNSEAALLQLAVDYQERHPYWREAPPGLT
jgi:aspartyl-tRNA(Asn)/glutamyl-tRNA(Gln) amidotransferase subunit A